MNEGNRTSEEGQPSQPAAETVASDRTAEPGPPASEISARIPLRTADIDPDALKVVRKLLGANHEAFLVGGCVRDLYLNRKPKDFDVATSARPEEIRRVFRNSRIIGRRFKLAHVFFGPKIIETSTFRASPQVESVGTSEGEVEGEEVREDLLITHDNEWGSVEEDARRRDFTINGLFYDIEAQTIVDYVDGVADLDRGIIRTIGDPRIRFREDPVRMIRAIKFAARLDFTVEPDCWAALLEHAPDIARCSRARLVEELYKLLRGGSSRRAFELMVQAGLFQHIWPSYLDLYEELGGLHRPQRDDPRDLPSGLFWRYLGALDDYVIETGQTPSNGVIQTVLFAPLLDAELREGGRPDLEGSIDDLMTPPCAALGVARRDRELARQIFMAHRRMIAPLKRGRGRISLVHRQYFLDALLFLAFSVEARDIDGSALEHWQALVRLQQGAPESGEKPPSGGGGSGAGGGGEGQGRKRSGKRRRKRSKTRSGRGPETSESRAPARSE
ncbi:polynucleotide adenylyltransferase PcnB [Nannocystaceae bacterium ST9]